MGISVEKIEWGTANSRKAQIKIGRIPKVNIKDAAIARKSISCKSLIILKIKYQCDHQFISAKVIICKQLNYSFEKSAWIIWKEHL